MTMNIKKAPLRNGLHDISMEEFWKDPLIVVETVRQKLNDLPIDTKKNPSLAKQIGTALELFRAVGMRRYGNISVLATLDLMQAAHYFLWLGDRNPDSQSALITNMKERARAICFSLLNHKPGGGISTSLSSGRWLTSRTRCNGWSMLPIQRRK